jgi:hypothetical protein
MTTEQILGFTNKDLNSLAHIQSLTIKSNDPSTETTDVYKNPILSIARQMDRLNTEEITVTFSNAGSLNKKTLTLSFQSPEVKTPNLLERTLRKLGLI